MGGIGKLMPWTRWMFLAGALALVGIFPFAGFFSKDSIIASTLNIGWYGYVFWVVALIGAFLTGLYTFRLYFIVFPGEPSAFVEEHHHDHHGLEGPWTMLIPVAVLTVLSVVGGWIQFEPLWHPSPTGSRRWRARSASPSRRTRRSGSRPRSRSALGLAGIAVAYAIYGSRRLAVPRLPAVQRVLEHKLYFDEAYDAVFYRPAAALATQLRRVVEEPFVLAGRLPISVRRRSDAGARRSTAPDRHAAHVRVLPRHGDGRARGRLPGGAMTVSSFTTLLICLPMGAAIAIWILPLSRFTTGSLAVLVSLLEVGIWIEQAARFDFQQSRPAVLAARVVDPRLARLVSRRRVRLLALARRAHRRLHGGGDRLRLLGRARPTARVLRPDALPHRSDGRRVRRTGPAALLRVLRGDADPALRPHRRVGRRGPARRDGEVRHLHDGRLAPHARRADRLRAEGRHVRPRRRADEREPLDLPRLHVRVRDQVAALPVPRLAARRVSRGAARGERRALGRDREGGPVRDAADRDHEVPRADVVLPHHDPRARGRGAHLRIAARVPRAGLPRRRRVLVACAIRADRDRPVLRDEPRLRRRRAADGRARPRVDVALPDRRRRRAADDDGRVRAARRHGARPAGALDAVADARRDLARRARLRRVRGRVPDPRGRVSSARGGGP